MKYKYYLLALLTGILFLTGCYDDKGNYDYKEINDIVIDTVGFKMTYTVLQYEELQIDPTVAFTRNPIPEGNLSYEWYIYQPGEDCHVETGFHGKEVGYTGKSCPGRLQSGDLRDG